MLRSALLESEIPGVPVRRGKVRDVYDFGDRLLFVATDRISAFDWVLPNGIPDKGRVLTKLSEMWFARLDVPHHFLTMDLNAVPLPAGIDRDLLAGRSMVVKKTDVIPVECVVRGYLSGSGWKEYQKTSSVCGIKLPAGLRESERLPEPIFTPATKEQSGHDINISFDRMCEIVGKETASRLRTLSLEVYRRGYEYARRKGVLIADTKFEFGSLGGQLILIDEVLTPDSSRFWPMDAFEPGHGQPSFDKQFVRDWLEQSGWDKNSQPPSLPEDIIQKTRGKYLEAYTRLVGEPFAAA
jgi:phosphoribosylaminoimidazole-succinocarboxamide synthase